LRFQAELADNLEFMSELDNFFGQVREIVDAALDGLVPPPENEPTRLYQAIRWSLFGGGKRFRPAMVIATGRVFGADNERLKRAAAAVEMIHTYSLIHDDLPSMDDDDLRRGRATVHRKFDEATAILAGDALQAMAFETIAGDEMLSHELRLGLVAGLSSAAGRMVAGQQLDLEAEGKTVDMESVERIHKGKTGALIEFSVRAGGMIAGTDAADMEALALFGEKLGLLFQITDDILDVTSTSEDLGKTAGKDIASKKATYPDVLGLDAARLMATRIESEAADILRSIPRDTGHLASICRYVASRNS